MAKLFARIVPGSRCEFDLVFKSNGLPFNFAPYSSGKLVFRNAAGVRSEIILDVPGVNPGSGVLRATLLSNQTAAADGFWASGDLELDNGSDTLIIPLTNKFEILKRNVPLS